MRVYNLTNKDLYFRKVLLPAFGGSKDFPELDSFISDSDKQLAAAKVISFGSLPKWWTDPRKPPKEEPKSQAKPAPKKASDTPQIPVELLRPADERKERKKRNLYSTEG